MPRFSKCPCDKHFLNKYSDDQIRNQAWGFAGQRFQLCWYCPLLSGLGMGWRSPCKFPHFLIGTAPSPIFRFLLLELEKKKIRSHPPSPWVSILSSHHLNPGDPNGRGDSGHAERPHPHRLQPPRASLGPTMHPCTGLAARPRDLAQGWGQYSSDI